MNFLNKGRTSDQQGETYITLSEQYVWFGSDPMEKSVPLQ